MPTNDSARDNGLDFRFGFNLKAELEIHRLHEKLDKLHKGEWKDLKEIQERQIGFLERLLSEPEEETGRLRSV